MDIAKVAMKILRGITILLALLAPAPVLAYAPVGQMLEITPVGPPNLWAVLRQYVQLDFPIRPG